MSGFGTSSIRRFSPERLILRWLARAGAKSATAAAITRMSAPGAARITASRIAWAVVASTTVTPRGGVTLMAPAMRVTDAPRSRAASAIAVPILPDERLPMKRTGIERLARAAGADDDVEPLQVARADEQPLDRLDDRGRLGQPADAGQPGGELADLGLDDEIAEVAQGGDVALGRRVRPHARRPSPAPR